jgi:hypothetical protein
MIFSDGMKQTIIQIIFENSRVMFKNKCIDQKPEVSTKPIIRPGQVGLP